MFEFFIENPLYLIPILIIIIIFGKKYIDYRISSYYKVTKHSFFETYNDKGKYGEYLTYKYLKQMEKNGAKFLFNLYIPKQSGGTVEIDVLMISPKGLFVFESKNYSGWIFGKESQQDWYQTLPAGRKYVYMAGRGYKSIYIPDKDKTCRKEKFYNPVKQNAGHIKALKKLLEVNIPMWSIIVFSDRCTLKNIELTSNDVVVINRYNIEKEIALIHSRNSIDALTENEIVELYKKLYPYTQVSKAVKEQHVRHIREYKDETQHCFQNVKAFEMKTQKNDTLKCPQCNGGLILKTATKGINKGNQFYGCSNYPKCKYIKDLTKGSNTTTLKDEMEDLFV